MEQMIREMGLFPFLFINAFLLAMAGVIIVAAVQGRRRAALVKSMPTTNIGMATDGYREFEGTIQAVPGAQLLAPLTMSPCAWYRAKLEKWVKSSGNREAHWSTIMESTSNAAILLRDTTGACLVFPYLAEVTPTDKSQWTGATAVPADRNPPRLGPTESTKSIVSISGTANTRFRYTEERIYVGDPLLVLGEYSTRQFEEPDEEDDEEDLGDGTLPDPDGEELDADDTDGDDEPDDEDAAGSIDWDAASNGDEVTRLAEQTTRACIQKGGGSKPFIMTTTKQETHVYINEVGSQAAMYLAVLPLGLVALLVYARYG